MSFIGRSISNYVSSLFGGGSRDDPGKLLLAELKKARPSASAVSDLLRDGADPSDKDEDGNTALHLASSMGNIGMVKSMLATDKAELESFNKDGMAALHLAAMKGHAQVCHALLAAGARVDSYNDDRVGTPLVAAVRGLQLNTANILLAAGANPNHTLTYEYNGKTYTTWRLLHDICYVYSGEAGEEEGASMTLRNLARALRVHGGDCQAEAVAHEDADTVGVDEEAEQEKDAAVASASSNDANTDDDDEEAAAVSPASAASKASSKASSPATNTNANACDCDADADDEADADAADDNDGDGESSAAPSLSRVGVLPVDVLCAEMEHATACDCKPCYEGEWCASADTCDVCRMVGVLYGEPLPAQHEPLVEDEEEQAEGEGEGEGEEAEEAEQQQEAAPQQKPEQAQLDALMRSVKKKLFPSPVTSDDTTTAAAAAPGAASAGPAPEQDAEMAAPPAVPAAPVEPAAKPTWGGEEEKEAATITDTDTGSGADAGSGSGGVLGWLTGATKAKPTSAAAALQLREAATVLHGRKQQSKLPEFSINASFSEPEGDAPKQGQEEENKEDGKQQLQPRRQLLDISISDREDFGQADDHDEIDEIDEVDC